MSTQVQPPAEFLHFNVGLPAFFEVIEKEAGVIPETQQDAETLWQMGMTLLTQEQQKQAQARVKKASVIAKAASALGLATAPQAPLPDISLYVKAALNDSAVKQAMSAYKAQVES